MGTEMGTISVMIPPNEDVINYYRNLGKEFTPVYADPDAKYVKEIELDIQDLKPQISKPHHPEDVISVEEVGDVAVDSIFIGSCTNGSYEDIKQAAQILKGKKVAPGVMVKAVPATRKDFGRLLSEGIVTDLFESGVIVSNPGCGGCAEGQIGMTGKGEVQVSTSNRNFKGKQGSGFTYLASPITAAASAIAGKIISPSVENL
jgi:3-isopropylmalate/(R)-2-methylmalate dehydratase large subunit